MDRRQFFKVGAGSLTAGAIGILAMPKFSDAFIKGGGLTIEEGLYILEKGKEKNIMPSVRPEILQNPKAVFIIETNVNVSPDKNGFFSDASGELEVIGKKVVSDLFVKGSVKGGSTLIKPNFTTVPDTVLSPVVGINVSPYFTAGMYKGLQEIGNTNVIFSDRGTDVLNHRKTGIYQVLDKYGINLIEANYEKFYNYGKNEINWYKVSNPYIWKNVPTYRPIGDKDNFFINLAKLKCHNLGLTTLTIKNLQGSVPSGYGQFCVSWGGLNILAEDTLGMNFKRDFFSDYQERVESSFLKHKAQGFKYWDYEGLYPVYQSRGGWNAFKKINDNPDKANEFLKDLDVLMWDEQWCQRAIDSASAIKPSINIIEGVIGRDGSGFDTGKDELCNVVIAGLSPLEVDSVGSWIMGHDPKELFYTRIAKERGLGENDPEKIQIFKIADGEIKPVKNLAEIKRYRLGVNLHTWKDTGKRLFW